MRRAATRKHQAEAVRQRPHRDPPAALGAPQGQRFAVGGAAQGLAIGGAQAQRPTAEQGRGVGGLGLRVRHDARWHARIRRFAARQAQAAGEVGGLHGEAPFLQQAAIVFARIGGQAQQHAQAFAHGGAQHVPTRFAQVAPAAFVEQHQVESVQRGRRHRQRRIAQVDATAHGHLCVQRETGIAGPAAQVFQFRAGAAGQHPDLQRRTGAHVQRHREFFQRLPVFRLQAQAVIHASDWPGPAQQSEAARVVGHRLVDPCAGRIQQFDQALRGAFRPAAQHEVSTATCLHRRMEFDHAGRQRRRREFDVLPDGRVLVARRQAGAAHAQGRGARMPPQRRGEIGHTHDARNDGGFGQCHDDAAGLRRGIRGSAVRGQHGQ